MTAASTPPIAWTIAGSDSGGGAGIQADLATLHDFGVHGCSVITALTAQNSLGVTRITETPVEQVRAELAALADDMPPQAIKTGMLANPAIVAEIVRVLARHDCPVICDPVMVTTSGDRLLGADEGTGVFASLFAHVDLLTPNLAEARVLTGLAACNCMEVEQVAARLLTTGVGAVLITGGHLAAGDDGAWDYFSDGARSWWLRCERIAGDNTHGSGCTLSAAIAAALARGYLIEDALVLAKAYVSAGIRYAGRPGAGPGPVAHTGFPRDIADLPVVVTGEPHRWRPRRFPGCGGAPLGLYPVVDSAEWVERLVELGVDTIQLRVKSLAEQPLCAEIKRAVVAARRTGARLFINDYWQLAIAAGAYGVHLGQEDLDTADLDAIEAAGLRLGISTHSWHEIARAHALAPSYIAIGPIYSTTTKQMHFAPQGLEQLGEWVTLLRSCYPLTAIGGIDVARAPGVLATGVGSIALVRAITAVGDYRAVVEQLQSLTSDAERTSVARGPVTVPAMDC